ncbi:hypothetical protein GWI33_008001 [Rhynchophorus ferrugineus]|uniref:Uncharacterized protein n=1 Tax=Rhynchophorus ferrugineus TaxID=354439 RepID=A0A834IDJ2_RHYFE|nr:hypothetical protein GWI33_008001 [Rhynchophorus ferrugineus]
MAMLPEHILPMATPKNKKLNRARKSSAATLLTGSPYKQQLGERIKCIDQKEVVGIVVGREKQTFLELLTTSNISEEVDSSFIMFIMIAESSVSSAVKTIMSESASEPAYPSNEDACSILCSANYSTNQGGETWIQYQSFELWAHAEC